MMGGCCDKDPIRENAYIPPEPDALYHNYANDLGVKTVRRIEYRKDETGNYEPYDIVYETGARLGASY